MSVLSILGILTIASLFWFGIGGIHYNNVVLIPNIWGSKNKIKRLILIATGIPLIGIISSVVGLLILSPFLELLGLNWFGI